MNRVYSIFSQILNLFPPLEFQRAVQYHKAERHMRGFTSWGQFVAMLFRRLGRAHTLREICGALAGCEGKLYYLGIPRAPKRSTLAYANEHRPWELFQKIFQQLLGKCQAVVAGRSTKKKFRKDRWQVELFFKAIEQNLKIKTFLGTSPNAVKTQIWTALIAMLVLRYLQLLSSFGWSLSNLVALLRHQLFVYRDLLAWLNSPFEGPPAIPATEQLQLSLEPSR